MVDHRAQTIRGERKLLNVLARNRRYRTIKVLRTPWQAKEPKFQLLIPFTE